MLLDDVQEEVERQGDELVIEGINAIDHWAKKLGVSSDELYDFIADRALDIVRIGHEEGVKVALMSGWFDGFAKGYVARERKERGTTT